MLCDHGTKPFLLYDTQQSQASIVCYCMFKTRKKKELLLILLVVVVGAAVVVVVVVVVAAAVATINAYQDVAVPGVSW